MHTGLIIQYPTDVIVLVSVRIVFKNTVGLEFSSFFFLIISCSHWTGKSVQNLENKLDRESKEMS